MSLKLRPGFPKLYHDLLEKVFPVGIRISIDAAYLAKQQLMFPYVLFKLFFRFLLLQCVDVCRISRKLVRIVTKKGNKFLQPQTECLLSCYCFLRKFEMVIIVVSPNFFNSNRSLSPVSRKSAVPSIDNESKKLSFESLQISILLSTFIESAYSWIVSSISSISAKEKNVWILVVLPPLKIHQVANQNSINHICLKTQTGNLLLNCQEQRNLM